MENYFKDIEKKLREKINIEKLEIIDNSSKHKGHKFFSKNKYHLHLKIKSLYLVMNILKDDLKTKIHALEISID